MTKRKKKQRKPTKVIQEPDRFLKASGSGYVKDVRYSLGADSRHPTPPEYLTGEDDAREPEPQAVYQRDQERFSKEGRERFAAEHPDEIVEQQARIFWNKLAKLQREGRKHGVDLAPRIQGLISEAQSEIVERRKKAA